MDSVLQLVGIVGSTFLVPLVVEWAKKHPEIPLNPSDTSLLRVITAVLAVTVGVLQAWLGGDLASFDFHTALKTLTESIMVFVASSGAYHLTIKK